MKRDHKSVGQPELEFQIPSDIGSIAPVVDEIVGRIRRKGCIPGRESDVEVALFEALANAVIHGNRQQAEKQVRICYWREPKGYLSIVIRDEGTGFDPAAVPDPTAPENLASEHGRGILLMKTFMDEVRFEKGGTEVLLVKKCDTSAKSAFRRLFETIANYIRSHSKLRLAQR
jgi:serine/threonine-protein kinase RsbW